MSKCIQCGLCVKVCGQGLRLEPEGPVLDHPCFKCGHCAAVCPTGFIDTDYAPRCEEIGTIPSYEDAVRYLRSVRSVRNYKEDLIDRETLYKLIDIGRYVQTGSNLQGISYIVMQGREKVVGLIETLCKTIDELPDKTGYEWLVRDVEIYRTTGNDVFFRGANTIIFALSDETFRRGRENAQFSLTFIALIAPTLGVGTCWAGKLEAIMNHPEYGKSINDYVQVPAGKRLRGALFAGIPDVKYLRLVERNPLELEFR